MNADSITMAELQAENERLRAELVESRARTSAVVDQSMFSVQLLSPDGRTRYVNPAFERLWGVGKAALDQIDYNMLTDPQLEERGIAPYIRRGFAGEACAIPVIRYDTGELGFEASPTYVAGYIYPVRDPQGTIIEVVVMHQDVTEQTLAEQALAETNTALQALNRHFEQQVAERTLELSEAVGRLQEADRVKDEFLSVISHELRTPLNFIMGFASILEDGVSGPLNAEQLGHMTKIVNGADRMLLLVNDLLDFAKLQSGMFDLEPMPTDYAQLVAEAVMLMRPLADQKPVSLTVSVEVAGPVVVDGPRVTQMITNLVANAIKFTDAGGRVEVRARLRDGELLTEVVDTGVGIAAADVPKLFKRFQQIEMGATRKAGGTGLGLAITKALVEAHGGRIGVESQPGLGSTFWFLLPMPA
jgi:signal transduction histidine kinase